MEIATMVEEFVDWLGMLSPEFAFMLATPFIVAAAALLQLWIGRGGRTPKRRRQEGAQQHGERGHSHRWSSTL